MNGLSDSLTIGLVLALVFGALFFYIYSRIGQVEKRVSLTENILLDLKMATENTLMSMTAAHDHNEEDEHSNIHIQAVSGPEPLPSEDVEQIPDEAYYKSVLQNAAATSALPTVSESTAADDNASVGEKAARLDVNYESMTLKELKALAKQRSVNTTNLTHKKDFIDALKRQGSSQGQGSILEPVPGSQGIPMGGLEEGFPVDLGSSIPA